MNPMLLKLSTLSTNTGSVVFLNKFIIENNDKIAELRLVLEGMQDKTLRKEKKSELKKLIALKNQIYLLL